MAGRQSWLTPNSLRLRLSLALIAAILFVTAASAAISYNAAFEEAIELQDNQLRQVAALAVRCNCDLSDASVAAAPVLDAEFEREARLRIARVPNGGSLPLEFAGLSPDLAPGFHMYASGDATWRLFVADAGGARMFVAQPTAIRDDIAHDGASRAAVAPLLLAPILLLIVAGITAHMTAPVKALVRDVDARAEDDVSRIPEERVFDEIRPLVSAINRQFVRIERTLRHQRRFIADAAHELRTPITALTLQVERLEAGDLSAESRERVNALREGIERSAVLLEQLLALARLQQEPPTNPLTSDPSAVLRRTLEMLLPLADQKQIEIGAELGMADAFPIAERDLEMVLRNLIENAVRYTHAGGSVIVALRREAGAAIIEVRDNGPGIPESAHESVLEPFHRAAQDEEGSGLGLSIVKAIADRYKGELSIGSADPGARISVRIPAAD